MHYYDSRDGGMPLIVSEYDVIQDPQWIFNETLSGSRNIEYYNLSEHANIEIYCNPERPVHYSIEYSIEVKNISPRHVDDASSVDRG